MAAVAVDTLLFKESPLSPYAQGGRPRSSYYPGGSQNPRKLDPLPADAIPPAIKTPSEVVGTISYVNSYISEAGLHRRNTLPPIIFDLFSPPPAAASADWPDWQGRCVGGAALNPEWKGGVSEEEEESEEEEGGEEAAMSHRRGRPVRRKKPVHHPEFRPPSATSKDTRDSRGSEVSSSQVIASAANSLLIELASYPGYDPTTPTPLPHDMDTLDLMRRVVRAQGKLALKHEHFREAWCRLFYCKSSRDIFLDYYWWFFLHKYQTNQLVIQDLLFTRISNNYVDLLCQPAQLKAKDTFFKMYPDIIAQCVYSAVIHAYPNSWNGFDDNFKTELCMYISLWQVGTKPAPSSWKSWQMKALEPPNLPKTEMKMEDIGGKLKAQGKFDLDALVREAKAAKQLETEKRIMAKLETSFGRKFSVTAVKRALSGSKGLLADRSQPSTPNQTEEEPQDGIITSESEEQRIGLAIEQLAAIERKATSSKARLLTKGQSPPSASGAPSRSHSPQLFHPRPQSPQHPHRQHHKHHNNHSPLRPSTPAKPSSSHRRSGSMDILHLLHQSEKSVRTPSPSFDPKHRRSTIHNIKMVLKTAKEKEKSSSELEIAAEEMGKHAAATAAVAAAAARKVVIAGGGQQVVATPSEKKGEKQQHQSGSRQQRPPQASAPATPHTKKSEAAKKHVTQSAGGRPHKMTPVSKSARGGGGGGTPRPRPHTTTTHTPKSNPKSAVTKSSTNSGDLKKMALSFKDRPTTTSAQERTGSATLKGPEFERVLFNLHGHSPLVKNYLDQMKLSHVNEKEVVVGRTEIAEEPPVDAVCYRDVLAESKAVGDKNRELFLRHYRQQKHSMISADKKRVLANQVHEQNVKLVLANRREVQTLSNELALHALQKRLNYHKVAVSDVLHRTLHRAAAANAEDTKQ